MSEKTLNELLEGVIKNVLDELKGKNSETSSCSGTGDAIPVELSARHVHLSEKDAIALFGAPLTPSRELSQPGQFLCEERVRLIGPKGIMENVAVLGPSRSSSQVEISMTDARTLGIKAPVRQSGDVAGSPGLFLGSPKAVVELKEGVIVAARHIHMETADAKRLCVADNDLVSVHVSSERPVIFEKVRVRVSDSFRLAMHIDLDEGNCVGWAAGTTGKIVRNKVE